jgi:hypothetical protein
VVAGEENMLACDPDPVAGTPGIKLELTAPLPNETPTPENPASAWMVETAAGIICELNTGATFAVDDMRANYGCTDGSWIFGDLKPGTVWTGLTASVTGDPPDTRFESEETVELSRVWR